MLVFSSSATWNRAGDFGVTQDTPWKIQNVSSLHTDFMDTVGLDFPSFAMWEKSGVYLVVQEVINLVLDPQVSRDDRITHPCIWPP